jgi:hypothetical protein
MPERCHLGSDGFDGRVFGQAAEASGKRFTNRRSIKNRSITNKKLPFDEGEFFILARNISYIDFLEESADPGS